MTGSDTRACKREALERHAQARSGHDHTGVAGRDDAHARRVDRPLGGLDAGHRAVRAAHEAQHLAVLDDVDAHGIGAARVAPGDRIVARDAAAPLQGGADHGIAHVRRYVERRTERLGLLRAQPLIVDAVQSVGVDMALEALHVVHVVRQHHHPALGEHDVVVELVRQAFPQPHGVLVDCGALLVEVVGADDRGIAPGIAAADPALLEHGDFGEAMLLGEVVGCGEAVPASAHDHCIVGGFRLGRAPLALPTLVTDKSLGQERAQREAMHRPPKIAPRQGTSRAYSRKGWRVPRFQAS